MYSTLKVTAILLIIVAIIIAIGSSSSPNANRKKTKPRDFLNQFLLPQLSEPDAYYFYAHHHKQHFTPDFFEPHLQPINLFHHQHHYHQNLDRKTVQQQFLVIEPEINKRSVSFSSSNRLSSDFSAVSWKIAALALLPYPNWGCSIGIEIIDMDDKSNSIGFMMLSINTKLRYVQQLDGINNKEIPSDSTANFGMVTAINLDVIANKRGTNTYKDLLTDHFSSLSKNGMAIFDLELDISNQKQGILGITNIKDRSAIPEIATNIPLFKIDWDSKNLAFRLKTESAFGSSMVLVKNKMNDLSTISMLGDNEISFPRLLSTFKKYPLEYDQPLAANVEQVAGKLSNLHIVDGYNNFVHVKVFNMFDIHFRWKFKQSDSKNVPEREKKSKCNIGLIRTDGSFIAVENADIPKGDREFIVKFVKYASVSTVKSMSVDYGNERKEFMFEGVDSFALAFDCESEFKWNAGNDIEIVERSILYISP